MKGTTRTQLTTKSVAEEEGGSVWILARDVIKP
jgi:hypothetical protein